MERYETALRAKDAGETYRYQVPRYLRALAEASGVASFRDLEREDLEAWFAQLRERGFTGRKGLSPTSLRTVASYTKAFLRWLNEGETPTCLRGLVIGKPRTRVRSKSELLKPDEMERLIRASNPQKAAILRLLWATGARPSEVLNLRHEDVAWETHNGMEYAELSFRDTKTGEPRTVPLADRKALGSLRDYLEIANGSDYLFPSPSRKGQPLTAKSLWAVMTRTAGKIGLKKRVYPYLFRHTRATELATAPRAYADRLMGWKSGVMWKNYTHLATDDLRDFVLGGEEGSPVKTIDEARELVDRLALEVLQNPDLAKKLSALLGE